MKEKLLRSAIFLFTAALIWHVLLPGPAAVRAPQSFFHTGRALLIGWVVAYASAWAFKQR